MNLAATGWAFDIGNGGLEQVAGRAATDVNIGAREHRGGVLPKPPIKPPAGRRGQIQSAARKASTARGNLGPDGDTYGHVLRGSGDMVPPRSALRALPGGGVGIAGPPR